MDAEFIKYQQLFHNNPKIHPETGKRLINGKGPYNELVNKYGSPPEYLTDSLNKKLQNFSLNSQESSNIIPTIQKSSNSIPTIQKSSNIIPTIQNTSNIIPTIQNSSNIIPTIQKSSNVIPTIQKSSNVIPPIQKSSNVIPTIQKSSNIIPTISSIKKIQMIPIISDELTGIKDMDIKILTEISSLQDLIHLYYTSRYLRNLLNDNFNIIKNKYPETFNVMNFKTFSEVAFIVDEIIQINKKTKLRVPDYKNMSYNQRQRNHPDVFEVGDRGIIANNLNDDGKVTYDNCLIVKVLKTKIYLKKTDIFGNIISGDIIEAKLKSRSIRFLTGHGSQVQSGSYWLVNNVYPVHYNIANEDGYNIGLQKILHGSSYDDLKVVDYKFKIYKGGLEFDSTLIKYNLNGDY